MKILFVCTGNTCRSPMAEAILNSKSNHEVQSAGIMATDGFPAASQTMEVLAQNGITLNHRSQSVSEELIDWAELILTMTVGHRDSLKQQFPNYATRIFTLKEYVDPNYEEAWQQLKQSYSELEEAKLQSSLDQHQELLDRIARLENQISDLDISDPFGSNVMIYQETYDELTNYLEKLVKKLQTKDS